MHPVFHVSMLKKCVGDLSLVVPADTITVKDGLTNEEIPVDILDRKFRTKEVASVRGYIGSRKGHEITYLHLFEEQAEGVQGVYDEHNPLLAKKAFDTGAYLYLEKPLHEEIVKHLWQFVLREKIQKKKWREGLEENGVQVNVIGHADDIANNNIVGDEEQAGEKNVPNTEEHRNNIHEAENNVVSNGKYKSTRKKGRKSTKETNEGESQSSANKAAVEKVFAEWTIDLHTKFMKVVQQIGEGSCYPLDILKVMNVHGLTKMQVASHLQKCRNNNWRAPDERKSICHLPGQGSSSRSQQRSSFKKFGRMPHLQTNIPSPQQQQRNLDQTQSGPHNTNNIY
ncbi:two-component response regulator ORR26-like [Lycium ferocissimum]|uniref:two-component response regulator ORR26-like n=1 Tax=Lycium ferocissimum TaxID=112874 RepID=UPI00281582E2|nr:two-component response regulator ORR26-like [Lycium ferocissimum]